MHFFAVSGAFLLVVFPISCYDIHNLKCKKERKGVFAIALTNASLPAKRRILKVCVKLFLEQGDAEWIIPMNPRCESLNAAVAAAIVMWQMQTGRPGWRE